MPDIKLNLLIKEENSIWFKRCIRKLLDSTFIVGDKDERLYSFIARESNRQDVSDYLRMIGLDVLVDTNVRIAMLRPFEADEETVGLKLANIIRFSTVQYHILLVLWESYLEKIGYSRDNTITMRELVDKLQTYEVDAGKKDLANALHLFKQYDLINYDFRDNSEDNPITLYPSLQFGWDLTQFRTVADEYMNTPAAEVEPNNKEEEDA